MRGAAAGVIALALCLANVLPGAEELGPRITPGNRFFSLRMPKGWVAVSEKNLGTQGAEIRLAEFRQAVGQEFPSIVVTLRQSGRPPKWSEPVDLAAVQKILGWKMANAPASATVRRVRLEADTQRVWIESSYRGDTGNVASFLAAVPVETGYIGVEGLFPEDSPGGEALHRAVVASIEVDPPWRYGSDASRKWRAVKPLSVLAAILLACLAARSNRRAGGYTGARPNWWKAPIAVILYATGVSMVLSAVDSGAVVAVAFSCLTVGAGAWVAAPEIPFLHARRPPSDPRQPNPWKLLTCSVLLFVEIDALLNPQRGPLLLDSLAELSGSIIGACLIGLVALWGMITELSRWRAQAKRLRGAPLPSST